MLNSMGLENKTLIYYIISGLVMLLCIWFLPSVCGIYSLLIGFTAIFGITTLLNLRLLNKNCQRKPRYLQFVLCAFLLLFPTVLFGIMLKRILISIIGTFFTFVVCSLAMVIFNALLYIGFNLVSTEYIKKKVSFTKKRNLKSNAN